MARAHEDDQHSPETLIPTLAAAPTRAPYQPPLLTNFGTIEHLTEGTGSVTADSGSLGSAIP